MAAAVRPENGHIGEARLAVGCVGPKSVRLPELEAQVRGLTADQAKRLAAESQAYLTERLEPVSDLLGSAEYKVYLTGVLLGRALAQAVTPPPGPLP